MRGPRILAVWKLCELDGALNLLTSRPRLQVQKANLVEVLEIAVDMALVVPLLRRDLGFPNGDLPCFIDFQHFCSLSILSLAAAGVWSFTKCLFSLDSRVDHRRDENCISPGSC
jgi:hypothetical protein